MSLVTSLAFAACFYACGYLGIRLERRRARVNEVNEVNRAPRLETAEQAALASLALRYAHGDPEPGRRLANHLRTKLPGVPDTEIARCVLALSHVARWYLRVSDSEAEALAGLLYAMGSAALDLTQLEREEMPR